MTSRIDPICGMQGSIEVNGHWFCSQHCAALFAQQAGRSDGLQAPQSPACHARPASWVRDPWVWVLVSGVLLSTAGMWWSSAVSVSARYLGDLRRMVVPLAVGLLIGGVIDHFVPREYIVKILSGPQKRVIVRSTLLGFLASGCSHGCLALAIELYRKGASTPAVVSFLLASPWANLSLTLILIGLFGFKGIVIVAAALVIACLTGLIFQRLATRGLVESNPQTVALTHVSIWQDVRERWRCYRWTIAQLSNDARHVAQGAISLGRMVVGWFQLGLALSALLGSLIPHGIFTRFLGPSLMGLMVTLLSATVIEVCSEGTAPLAFELYRQTGALGNAFVFLMAGVVTDYTELGALWSVIGRRTVWWLLVVTLPIVIALGVILNGWKG